jgi:hypothetical protein
MSRKSLYDLLWAILWIYVLVSTWIEFKKIFGTIASLGIFVAVPAVFGVLFALERHLKKTKSEEWMSRYHICLAVAYGLGILVVIFVMLRSHV